MVKNGKKQGTMRFTVAPGSEARQVFLAGDFTGWEPVAMRRQKGTFGLTLSIGPGTYQYKYVVDEQ